MSFGLDSRRIAELREVIIAIAAGRVASVSIRFRKARTGQRQLPEAPHARAPVQDDQGNTIENLRIPCWRTERWTKRNRAAAPHRIAPNSLSCIVFDRFRLHNASLHANRPGMCELMLRRAG